MGSSAGYEILSPTWIEVAWSGRREDLVRYRTSPSRPLEADSEHPHKTGERWVSTHSCLASFTVQTHWVVRTARPGDFVAVVPIANFRFPHFQAMSAMVEAWWNPANFGIVCLLNGPCHFEIPAGTPLAQMFVVPAETLQLDLHVTTKQLQAFTDFTDKRARRGQWQNCPFRYKNKDLDYMGGRLPDGTKDPHHIRRWTRKVIHDETCQDRHSDRCPHNP